MTNKKEEPKAETVEDNDPYGAAKRETSADLDPYNAASKSATNAIPKKAAEKLTPKAEAPTSKEEPKAAPKSKESAFKDSPTAFKDSSSPFKGGSASAADKEEPKERSLPRGQAKANEGVSSFIKKSMDQIGQEGRDQEARYKATQAKMKESGENLSPRMKAAKASEKAKGMKAGGSVRSSASKRADGCAIRGKTRA
jgi:hypothetical protein